MFYLHKTPAVIQWLTPSLRWHQARSEPNVYLTFDDGPIPDLTPEILKILEKHNAKATFFCVGENIKKHPDLFRDVVAGGHAIGNHTQHHIDGWKTGVGDYLSDVAMCQEQIRNAGIESILFRPPYGKITRSQIRELKKDFTIIMWDVLSGDFDQSLTPEECIQRTLPHVKPGSIIIFHDNIKATPRVLEALPRLLTTFQDRQWKCLPLH